MASKDATGDSLSLLVRYIMLCCHCDVIVVVIVTTTPLDLTKHVSSLSFMVLVVDKSLQIYKMYVVPKRLLGRERMHLIFIRLDYSKEECG
jgi:hypothetical protein